MNPPQSDGILTESTFYACIGPRRIGRRYLYPMAATTLFAAVMSASAVSPAAQELPPVSEAVYEELETPVAVTEAASTLPFVYDERVRAGDTLTSLLRRIGLKDDAALAFIEDSKQGKEAMRSLRTGRSVLAMIRPDGTLHSLQVPLDSEGRKFAVARSGSDALRIVSKPAIDKQIIVEMRSGTIRNSLYAAIDSAGVPDRVASKFVELFSNDVDFSKDLRAGDRFSIVYETEYENGVAIRSGRVLAAEFVNKDESHTVVLYRDQDGEDAYFTAEGEPLSQAFLQYPLEFTRISSTFGMRMHPVLGYSRAHNGVDFTAPTGTPVMAATDGRIAFMGVQSGYGNTVIIEHRDGYSTLYAHLSRFNNEFSPGQKVRQGQVVAYVGSTGVSTGPHLHYEVRLNGTQLNPLDTTLPRAGIFTASERAAFNMATKPLVEKLALLNDDFTVARAD